MVTEKIIEKKNSPTAKVTTKPLKIDMFTKFCEVTFHIFYRSSGNAIGWTDAYMDGAQLMSPPILLQVITNHVNGTKLSLTSSMLHKLQDLFHQIQILPLIHR